MDQLMDLLFYKTTGNKANYFNFSFKSQDIMLSLMDHSV
jgi:hypothetical protein